MNRNTKIALIGLCVSAAIMIGILFAYGWNDSAFAGESVGGGHYIMFTGSAPGATDLLYVIDRRSQKMNMYDYNTQTETLMLVNQWDLEKAFR